jgi:hypothetical protein
MGLGWTSLVRLDLSTNYFTSVNAGVGSYLALTELSLADNRCVGMLQVLWGGGAWAPCLHQWDTVELFWASNEVCNRGCAPHGPCARTPPSGALCSCYGYNTCSLSGPFPAVVRSLTGLSVLSLSGNFYRGALASYISELENLKVRT